MTNAPSHEIYILSFLFLNKVKPQGIAYLFFVFFGDSIFVHDHYVVMSLHHNIVLRFSVTRLWIHSGNNVIICTYYYSYLF